MTKFSEKLALFSVRHAKGIVCGWIVFALIAAGFALRLPDALGDHGLTTNGQYALAQQRLAAEFRIPDEPVVILFENDGGYAEKAFRSYVRRFLKLVDSIEGATVAASPLERKEMERGGHAYAWVSVQGSVQEKRQRIESIRRLIPAFSPLKIAMTGKPVVQEDVNRSSKEDLKAAETVGIPVAFALLALALGGWRTAWIPIATGGMSVLVAMGLMFVVGSIGGVSLSVFVYNVIPMAGMAVCLDFALMMVSRYREERASLSVGEAVVGTMATSGKAVFLSAGCVVLALIGTFYIRMPIFNTVALGALVATAVSAAMNLTFVPALLCLLGWRIPPQRRDRRPRGARGGWNAFLSAVLKRPVLSAIMASTVLILCLLPVQRMRVDVPGPESLPRETESRLAAETMAKLFQPSSLSQVYLIVDETRDGSGRNRAPTVDRIRRDLQLDAQVLKVGVDRSEVKESSYLISATVKGNEKSKEVLRWVREREERYAAIGVLVGGEPKYRQEVVDEILARAKYVLAFVAASNFIWLAWAFRSLLVPAKAVLMNLLSIGASFGIVTWICQDGRWGMESSDMAIMIPVFIFGLVFGISMDYGIFLLSRINESFRRTRDNEQAIREGLAASGAVIASAAAIMIAVTAPFALAGVTGVKQLGIGIAAALWIDATVIRLILLPSLIKLFGKWNWWMPFVRN